MLEENSSMPFLRWAGGKNWFVNKYASRLTGLEFNNYHEPFLGGGAVFFSMLQYKNAYLSDQNENLINTYICVRDNPSLVIDHMRAYENTESCYYRVRGENYRGKYQRAAQFVYLNQTSYNGIYRVNLKGEYNVPYGRREKNFLDEKAIYSASRSLQSAVLSHGDFYNSLKNIRKGDLVFLDPPYTVSHNNNGFIKYNKALFSLEDQRRLARFIAEINEKGASYILTNAAHQMIKTIFGEFNSPRELTRASLIGGKKAVRGSISEYMFTNLEMDF